jgi:branched-chain amino acid aminotransferase
MENSNGTPTPSFKNGFGRISPLVAFSEWYEDSGSWTVPQVLEWDDYPKPNLLPALNPLHYGGAVFEGMRANLLPNGKLAVFALEEHCERLRKSLFRMDLPDLPPQIFLDAISELLMSENAYKVNFDRGEFLYIRPLVYIAEEAMSPDVLGLCHFAIITLPHDKNFFKPVKCWLETGMSRAAEGGVAMAKTAGNYSATRLAKRMAKEQSCQHVLWTDNHTHAQIEEFSTMNVFTVRDGILHTPGTERGTILHGITRKTVITKSPHYLNTAVKVGPISVEEMLKGIENGSITEVFGTGTASTVVPISSIMHESGEYSLPKYNEDSMSYRVFEMLNDFYHEREPVSSCLNC